jgi:hypothetical protein
VRDTNVDRSKIFYGLDGVVFKHNLAANPKAYAAENRYIKPTEQTSFFGFAL